MTYHLVRLPLSKQKCPKVASQYCEIAKKGILSIKYSIHQRTRNRVYPKMCDYACVKLCYGKTVKLVGVIRPFGGLIGVPRVTTGSWPPRTWMRPDNLEDGLFGKFWPIQTDFYCVKPCMGKRSTWGVLSVLMGLWLGHLGVKAGGLGLLGRGWGPMMLWMDCFVNFGPLGSDFNYRHIAALTSLH